MTTEEKAKAYDEVRKKIASRFGSNVAEEIFSEFEISEDEKIRKELIEFVKSRGGFKHEYIAWLEKQKEYESTDFKYVWDRTDCGDLTSALDKYSEEAIINMCHAWYDKGIELERKSWIEKQGEERTVNYPIEGMFPYTDPADTLDGEIENIWNKLRNCDNTFTAAKSGFYEVIHHFANWLEKQGEQTKIEALRTEYEKGRADAIAEMYVPTQISPEESLGVSSEKYMDIVDTLTQGGQKPAKWSLEDERVIAIINNALTESNTPPDDYDKVYDWLESIKQRIVG